MSGGLVLGVDIGTGSTKVVVCGPTGQVVASTSSEHGVDLPHRGHVEQDAETVWWRDLTALIRSLDDDVRCRVEAVAVSGLGPCVLITDHDCRPLRPAILYGVDTRAVNEIEELNELFGADAITAACGSKLSTQAAGPKLRWLARHEPDVFGRARYVHSASSFVVHRLTGRYVMDHHTASQYDPLYELSTHTWRDEWWAELAGQVEAPALLWSGEVAGTLSPAAAEATGLPAGVPVTAGCVDAWAEAYSVDVVEPGRVMVMYGSTMFFIAPTAEQVAHPALWTTVGIGPHGYCVAGGMATSGSLTTWLRDITGAPLDELFADASTVPPGARGLLALPYFAGERTPIADPLATGWLCGLTLRHGRGDLLRAMLEATAFGVRHNIAALADAGVDVTRLVAVGGGTRGDLWSQIVSNVTGIPQEIPAVTVGAAFGDARMAAAALGWDVDQWVRADRVIEPNPAAGTMYDELWPLYLDAYQSNVHIMHRLSQLAAEEDHR